MIDSLQYIISDTLPKFLDTMPNIAVGPQAEVNSDSPFTFNLIISYVISGLCGVIIGVFYSLFIEAKFKRFLARVMPKLFRRKKTLDGEWELTWHVQSVSFPPENKSDVI